jgi:hypothetical protein
MPLFTCRRCGKPGFLRTTGTRPVPNELRNCLSCEQADDAIRGLQEGLAGGFAPDGELDAALGAPTGVGRTTEKEHAMTEIRVAWQFGLHETEAGEPLGGGVWFPDTPESRRELTIVVEAGNEVAGEGTHWLEERQA